MPLSHIREDKLADNSSNKDWRIYQKGFVETLASYPTGSSRSGTDVTLSTATSGVVDNQAASSFATQSVPSQSNR